MKWRKLVIIPKDDVSRELLYLFFQGKAIGGLWENGEKIIVYLEEQKTLDDLPTNLVKHLEETEEPESDWKNYWKKKFPVVWVEKNITIRPPWIGPTGAGIDLVIYPGLAFGTGHHPTTLWCIRMLKKYCKKGNTLLDVGTGSGILSIFASKIGASRIVALDIDPLTQKELQRNCALNNIHPQKIDFKLGSIADVRGKFDLLVVNISPNFIIENAPLFEEKLVPGGLLIVSGFERKDIQKVCYRLNLLGFQETDRAVQNNWVTMVFSKSRK